MNYTRCLRDFYDRVLVKESCKDFMDILSPVPFMNALLKMRRWNCSIRFIQIPMDMNLYTQEQFVYMMKNTIFVL